MVEENIYNMGFAELWSMFLVYTEGDNSYQEETNLIKFGIDLPIEHIYYSNEWYELFPNKSKVICKNKKYNLIEFIEEKEKRELIMRKIIDKIKNQTTFQGREE